MNETHQRIEITRADYEATLGLKADPGTIGACLYGTSSVLLREYVFVEPSEEVKMLERLYAL